MKYKYKGIDLFCGIGGFRLAMKDNKVECVFSSDNDKLKFPTPTEAAVVGIDSFKNRY